MLQPLLQGKVPNSTADRSWPPASDPRYASYVYGLEAKHAMRLHARLDYTPSAPPPMLRFCKSSAFAEVLVPDNHFFTRGFGLVDSWQAFHVKVGTRETRGRRWRGPACSTWCSIRACLALCAGLG